MQIHPLTLHDKMYKRNAQVFFLFEFSSQMQLFHNSTPMCFYWKLIDGICYFSIRHHPLSYLFDRLSSQGISSLIITPDLAYEKQIFLMANVSSPFF
jgi:hypothetical protein